MAQIFKFNCNLYVNLRIMQSPHNNSKRLVFLKLVRVKLDLHFLELSDNFPVCVRVIRVYPERFTHGRLDLQVTETADFLNA